VEKDEMKSLFDSQVFRSNQLSEELKQAKQLNAQLKQQYDSETERLRREADKRVQAIKSVSGLEKMELRKISWELETKLESAKLDLIVARKEYQSWKDKASILEEQLQSLHVSSGERNTELQEQLEADRMFYAKSQLSTKQRMGKFVQMFLRRTNRRDLKATKTLQESIAEWRQRLKDATEILEEEKQLLTIAKEDEIRQMELESRSKISDLESQMDLKIFELNERIAEVRAEGLSSLDTLRVKHEMETAELLSKTEIEKKLLITQVKEESARASNIQLEELKRILSAAKDEEMARITLDYQSNVSALKSDMDKKINELNALISEIRAEGITSLDSLRAKNDIEMAELVSKLEQEKEEIISEKDKERARAIEVTENSLNKDFEKRLDRTMSSLRGQMDREKNELRMDLTQQIMNERNCRTNLEGEMIEIKDKVMQYEQERSSIRSLLLLSWRLSKQRGLNFIRRR